MPLFDDSKTLNFVGGAVLIAAFVGYWIIVGPSRPDAHDMPDGEIKNAVLDSELPVLVDFYADWCGPCKRMGSILDDFADRNSDVKVLRVNVDRHGDIARHFSVSSIPTLMVFKEGKMTARRSGVMDHNGLRSLLEK